MAEAIFTIAWMAMGSLTGWTIWRGSEQRYRDLIPALFFAVFWPLWLLMLVSGAAIRWLL